MVLFDNVNNIGFRIVGSKLRHTNDSWKIVRNRWGSCQRDDVVVDLPSSMFCLTMICDAAHFPRSMLLLCRSKKDLEKFLRTLVPNAKSSSANDTPLQTNGLYNRTRTVNCVPGPCNRHVVRWWKTTRGNDFKRVYFYECNHNRYLIYEHWYKYGERVKTGCGEHSKNEMW